MFTDTSLELDRWDIQYTYSSPCATGVALVFQDVVPHGLWQWILWVLWVAEWGLRGLDLLVLCIQRVPKWIGFWGGGVSGLGLFAHWAPCVLHWLYWSLSIMASIFAN